MHVQDLNHSLERMVLHALLLLRDVSVVEKHAGHTRPGGYLLQLIALEILLKAGALRDSERRVPQGHDVEKLFEMQSEGVRERVKERFLDRELQLRPKTGAPLHRQLRTLGRNFVDFRYVYEEWFQYSEEDRLQKERAFVEGDLPVEEWDVIYYSQLLDILLSELLQELEPWRPSEEKLPPLRWEKSR